MQLVPKDLFPTVSGVATDGEWVTLPDAASGSWAVLLFYRGHW